MLASLANRDMADVYTLIDMAQDKAKTAELTHDYSLAETNEIIAILQKMFVIQRLILQVNQAYIAAAGQDDAYRTEPAFKLQGSYRNMNKMTEKLSAVMNEAELEQLIHDHYVGEAQLLTKGTESNLLKLAELQGTLTPEQFERWQAIKADFIRNQKMGGDSTDTGNRIVAQLVDMVSGFDSINQRLTDFANTHHSEEKAQRQFEQQLALTQIQLEKQAESQSRQQQILSEHLSQQITQGIASSLEQNMVKLLNFYVQKQNFDTRQTHAQQAILQQQLTSLTQAVENLAVLLKKNVETNIEPKTAEADEHAHDQQVTQLATVVQNSLQPLLMRLDEKLQVDISTGETGKLIVNMLQRLNEILQEE